MPKLIKIKQKFNNSCIKDIGCTLRSKLKNSNIGFKPGARIAIAVGSRGIDNISLIVKESADYLKEHGAVPFIIPAMGSHGGATSKGQAEILGEMGIDEQSMGVPVISSMDVIEIPAKSSEYRLYMDRAAYDSDGIIVINRIKMHTDFRGKTESGLLKMCVIGLGKDKQAEQMHKHGIHGLRDLIPMAAEEILKTGKVLFGIGIVENAYDNTAIIEIIRPELMIKEEIRLLETSKKLMPSLPVDILDILIIDEMGKDISGTGVDTNIIGRLRIIGEPEFAVPNIKRIIISDLTHASHGNALGIGLADFTTKNLYSKIDFRSTYENLLTSSFLERGKIPVIADNSKQAFEFALRSLHITSTSNARIIRIKNTLNLDQAYVSDAVMKKISSNPDICSTSTSKEMFTSGGELVKF